MAREQTSTDISSGLVYQTYGFVPTSAREEAEQMMAQLSEHAPKPLRVAKVKVKSDDHRSPDEHYVVQGTLDFSGPVVRAQAAGPTARDALSAVKERLLGRLRRIAGDRRRATKRPPSAPASEWHRGDLVTGRPEFHNRPPEDRRLVRRKKYSSLDRLSASQAMFDMDVRDYRFYMFTDESDDKVSIVFEDGDGVAIRKVDGSRPDDTSLRPDISVNETPIPAMEVGSGITQLNSSALPFVFLREPGQRNPSVLYRRYDGHYGLISPSSVS